MQVLLFFNELSSGAEMHHTEADAAMKEMVDSVRKVARHRPGSAMISPGLAQIEISKGYTLGQWRNRPENRELGRWLFSLANRAPFARPMSTEETEVEYQHDGRAAIGLGAAHLNDGLAVSLRTSASWRESSVPVERTRVTEGPEGDLYLICDRVDVRHLAQVDHVDAHSDWITLLATLDLSTGREIWSNREDFFPNLRFLAQTEAMLDNMSRDWVQPVSRQLALINRAALEWNSGTGTSPLWQSKVTPEHQSRRASGIFDFEDEMYGEVYTFDSHSRFTPGPGRVHFRLDSSARKVVIGYLGRKLD